MDGEVPIGRPVAETRVHVLDRRLRPLPPALTGELCVGGPGVARGYLRRPALTAERFVPHPGARRPGDRLYRTGDLARFRPGGHLELAGRLDRQLKVRGFRVEPQEIEAALGAHPAVREAAVVVREGTGANAGHRRLAGHVVARGGTPVSVRELRGFLRRRLPDFMVPPELVVLAALPLTPHGKVDRAALRRGELPAVEAPALDSPHVPPRTPVEEKLAAIWARILQRERLGLHDNFFELGGDSILSLRIVAQAHREGLRFTLRDLYRHPTVAELAPAVSAPVPTAGGPVTGPLPLTPIQRWFFELDSPQPWHYNWAVFYRPSRPPDPRRLERAFTLLVEHHDALRLRFERREDGWRQTCAAAVGGAPWARVDLSRLGEAELPRALESAAAALQASLDLAAGPLLRLVGFDTAAGRCERLLLVVHHLAVDAVSWALLQEDLEALYRQTEAPNPVTLPARTTSFGEWAERLSAHAGSQELRRELDFWRRQGARAADLRLPVDFAAGPDVVGASDTVSVSLTRRRTRELLRRAPAADRTRVDEVLLTAVARAFERWTGSSALFVDVEGHGREELFPEVDLSRTVGWFTSVYPVLVDLGGAAGEGAALQAVREQLRSVPRRGLGFGLLRYLSPDEAVAGELRRLPLPQVSFNYLGRHPAAADLDASRRPLLAPAAETSGPLQSPRTPRSTLLELNGALHAGRLWMHWTYSRRRHRRATIENLARGFLEELEALVEHFLAAAGLHPTRKEPAAAGRRKV